MDRYHAVVVVVVAVVVVFVVLYTCTAVEYNNIIRVYTNALCEFTGVINDRPAYSLRRRIFPCALF